MTLGSNGAATFSSSVQAVGTMFLQRASGGASTTIQFKNEIMENPEILDYNKDIATTSELIDIPEFVKASTSFFKSPLKSIGDFFSGALDAGKAGGGLFGRKPQE